MTMYRMKMVMWTVPLGFVTATLGIVSSSSSSWQPPALPPLDLKPPRSSELVRRVGMMQVYLISEWSERLKSRAEMRVPGSEKKY